jgi:hypothetical protein
MIHQHYFDKIKAFFDGDEVKAWRWWKTPNPAFSMFSPIQMIKKGREAKVKSFIDSSMNENIR